MGAIIRTLRLELDEIRDVCVLVTSEGGCGGGTAREMNVFSVFARRVVTLSCSLSHTSRQRAKINERAEAERR
jgi:hypothetical protein